MRISDEILNDKILAVLTPHLATNYPVPLQLNAQGIIKRGQLYQTDIADLLDVF